VLLIPGGGYARVVIDNEGFEGGRYFAERGLVAYVLRYRLPGDGWAAGPDAPLQDAQRAVRLIRSRHPGLKVVAVGFSAGGHLTGMLANRGDERIYDRAGDIDDFAARPDGAALAYPVASMVAPHTHAGSRTNLLGEAPSREAADAYSLETLPHAGTPPHFLFSAADDASVPVENTLGYHAALRAAGVPTDLHVFPTGGHGFGFRIDPAHTAQDWPSLMLSWADRQIFLKDA
jgi:acetyl esterase/lipase